MPRSLWEDQELSDEATNTGPTGTWISDEATNIGPIDTWKAIIVVSHHYKYNNGGSTCSIPRGE